VRARDNPFRSDRVLSLRYRLETGTWKELLARFDALGRRAAIVGPEGSGKTTLLEDLAPLFRERGCRVRDLRLDRETPSFQDTFLREFSASLGPRDVILFDGAEQLGRRAWAHFERRSRVAGGLLATLHRPGRLPTLLETRTSPELLEGLVGQILGDRLDGVRSLTSRLYERHGGNLREALRELYDHYAALAD
jgi:energy-coupling factor transporter ATP-binding protein EcfA2